MAIRVAAGTADLICDYADGFVVEITGASDVDAATRALARARRDIEALSAIPAADPEGPVVSQPVLGPAGPLIRVARLERTGKCLTQLASRLPRQSYGSIAAGHAIDEWLERDIALDLIQSISLLEDEWSMFA